MLLKYCLGINKLTTVCLEMFYEALFFTTIIINPHSPRGGGTKWPYFYLTRLNFFFIIGS